MDTYDSIREWYVTQIDNLEKPSDPNANWSGYASKVRSIYVKALHRALSVKAARNDTVTELQLRTWIEKGEPWL